MPPTTANAFCGETAIAASGGVTVRDVDPVTPPKLAVMAVVPLVKALADPTELIVATGRDDEFHATDAVRSSVPPSAKEAMARNSTDDPVRIT